MLCQNRSEICAANANANTIPVAESTARNRDPPLRTDVRRAYCAASGYAPRATPVTGSDNGRCVVPGCVGQYCGCGLRRHLFARNRPTQYP
eukprot:3117243-Rhodomonas_salina.1